MKMRESKLKMNVNINNGGTNDPFVTTAIIN